MSVIEFPSKVRGEFRLSVIKDGNIKVLADWFPNLITNSGMDYLGENPSTYAGAFCRVGSGNTTPAFSDTALVSQVAVQSFLATGGSRLTAPDTLTPYGATVTYTYQFGVGQAAGNLSEIGVSPEIANDLFCRALILDGLGNPTTITILSDEILVVNYRIIQYPVLTDTSGTVTLDSISYDFDLRAAWVSASTSNNGLLQADYPCMPLQDLGGSFWRGGDSLTLGAITAEPADCIYNGTTGVAGAYTISNYYRDCTYSATINDMNPPGGVGSVVLFNSRGSYQIAFDPIIPKDNTKILSFVIRFSWARV